MTVLLAVTAWMLVVALAAGLCVIARRGDLRQAGRGELRQAVSAESAGRVPTVLEFFERAEIVARANARPGGGTIESGSALPHGDGVAA